MKQVLDEKTKEGIKLISNVLKDIGEKKITTAITLMKDSNIGDADLMEVLSLGTSNSAAYYRKELEKEGVIRGYSAEIDWGKLGCPVQFTIIVESDMHEILLEMGSTDFIHKKVQHLFRGRLHHSNNRRRGCFRGNILLLRQ